MKILFLTLVFCLQVTRANDFTAFMSPSIQIEIASKIIKDKNELDKYSHKNWKVGDFHKLSLHFSFHEEEIAVGSKTVLEEVPELNAFWYEVDIKFHNGNRQNVKELIRRSDGQKLKKFLDGREVNPYSYGWPSIKILEQRNEKVKVPAGEFDCLYSLIAYSDARGTQHLESWVNNTIGLDGEVIHIFSIPLTNVIVTVTDYNPKLN